MIFYLNKINQKDIERMNKVATEQDFELYIRCDNVFIDLRSFLGLFTLLGKSGVIIAPDHADPKAFAKALKKMGFLN